MYRIIEVDTNNITPDKAIGVKFPFNGPGVFNKSFTTFGQPSTNVKSLILTRKGERYEQPEFGTDLVNVLFEPNVAGIKEFITKTITDAVNYWLPYLTITNLQITTREDDPNMIHTIKISLSFSVTGSNSEKTISIFAGEDGIIKVE